MAQNYQLVEQLSITQVEDEVVLLNLTTGSYYGLNATGAKFVAGLQEQKTIHQICSHIAEQYQMPYQDVNCDLDELIAQLLEQRLIEPIET